ncbi:MAG: NAD(P)-binding domain-containing protein [Alkalispirochaetaceae bacterium]
MISTDTLLIGAGPIGLEVAAALKRGGAEYTHLEGGCIGETISRWPRRTVFFSSPEWIAIAGVPIHTVGQEQITGEEYLAYLRLVVETLGLEVSTYERVTSVRKEGEYFLAESEGIGYSRLYRSRRVVFALGDMAKPRVLGLPGEDQETVFHHFDDPHRYFQRELLIVGGRNSALEAALRSWRAGARVTLSYRGRTIDKNAVLSRLHLEISLLIRNRKIVYLPETEPVAFAPGKTTLRHLAGGREEEIKSDFVFLATGFIPDHTLLEELGVRFHGQTREPEFDPETMETNVAGVYVAGTATGGNQNRYKVFITTSHPHAARIARSITGKSGGPQGNYPNREYPLAPADIE